MFILTTLAFAEPVVRSDLVLCVLVVSLTFPGHNRFKDKLLKTGIEINGSWLVMLVILWLCGYATKSLSFFNGEVLLVWALLTPQLQWLAVAASTTASTRACMPTPAPPCGAS